MICPISVSKHVVDRMEASSRGLDLVTVHTVHIVDFYLNFVNNSCPVFSSRHLYWHHVNSLIYTNGRNTYCTDVFLFYTIKFKECISSISIELFIYDLYFTVSIIAVCKYIIAVVDISVKSLKPAALHIIVATHKSNLSLANKFHTIYPLAENGKFSFCFRSFLCTSCRWWFIWSVIYWCATSSSEEPLWSSLCHPSPWSRRHSSRKIWVQRLWHWLHGCPVWWKWYINLSITPPEIVWCTSLCLLSNYR